MSPDTAQLMQANEMLHSETQMAMQMHNRAMSQLNQAYQTFARNRALRDQQVGANRQGRRQAHQTGYGMQGSRSVGHEGGAYGHGMEYGMSNHGMGHGMGHSMNHSLIRQATMQKSSINANGLY